MKDREHLSIDEMKSLVKKGLSDEQILQYARQKGYMYLQLDDIRVAKNIPTWKRR